MGVELEEADLEIPKSMPTFLLWTHTLENQTYSLYSLGDITNMDMISYIIHYSAQQRHVLKYEENRWNEKHKVYNQPGIT